MEDDVQAPTGEGSGPAQVQDDAPLLRRRWGPDRLRYFALDVTADEIGFTVR